MISAEIKGGNISLMPLGDDFVESMAASTSAKIANEFGDFIKNRRFDELFESHGGVKGSIGKVFTKDTIGAYRKKGKVPVYIVRAGLGVPGNLNYLAGPYRGKAVSRAGKVFSYEKKRDLINDGWKAWGGDQKAALIGEELAEKKVSEGEKKLEG